MGSKDISKLCEAKRVEVVMFVFQGAKRTRKTTEIGTRTRKKTERRRREKKERRNEEKKG